MAENIDPQNEELASQDANRATDEAKNGPKRADVDAGAAEKPADAPKKEPAPPPEVSPAPAPSPVLVATPMSTSYFDLLKAVVGDQKLNGEEKKTLILQLKGISPTSDRLTYRTAIWIIGFIAIVTVIAIWHLANNVGVDKVPQGLIAIGSGAVGGLAGLLTPSKNTDTHS